MSQGLGQQPPSLWQDTFEIIPRASPYDSEAQDLACFRLRIILVIPSKHPFVVARLEISTDTALP